MVLSSSYWHSLKAVIMKCTIQDNFGSGVDVCHPERIGLAQELRLIFSNVFKTGKNNRIKSPEFTLILLCNLIDNALFIFYIGLI